MAAAALHRVAGCTDIHLVMHREQPEIMDYIRLKAAVSDLEKKVVDWDRKNEIADMDLSRTQKLMARLPSLKSSKSLAPLSMSMQVTH